MLTGYIEFALLLFLPGLATLAVFKQLRSGNPVSILARSYGISLSLNSLLVFATNLAVREVTFLPVALLALSSITVGAFAMMNITRIRSSLRSLISGEQLAVLLLGVVFAVLVLSQFIKYPIFPKTYSIDFSQHIRITNDIISSGAGGLSALFYYGVHYNLALGLLLTGGVPFIQLQVLMAILVAPSSLLIYEFMMRTCKSFKLALVAQVLFISTGFVWYVPLYDSGLFPNLFSIILSLAYLVELQSVLEGKGIVRFFTFAIVAFALYFSHYLIPIFMVAAFACLIVGFGFRLASLRRIAIPIIITLAPLVSLVIRPDLVLLAFQLLQTSGSSSSFTYSTPLADYFAFNPFLRYLVAEIFNYPAILLILDIPFTLYYIAINLRGAWIALVLPIWVGLLWIITPNGELAWRLSFEALMPILLQAPAAFVVVSRLLKWLLVDDKRARKVSRAKGRSGRRFLQFETVVIAILILITFSGSWSNVMIEDLNSNASQYAQAQTDLYNSIIWFAHNTPSGSSLLSVTDWRIYFMETITGRPGQLLIFSPATQAISYAQRQGFRYILVTYSVPADPPAGFDPNAFFSSFSSNRTLKIVYKSGYDVIYQAQVPTTTTISCLPTSLSAGQRSICTATVSGVDPTGTVGWSTAETGTFFSSQCSLSSGANSRTCSVSYSQSTAGPVALTANYAGDSNNLASSGSTAARFTPAPTTTSVSCSPLSLGAGQTASCTATVSGVDPTGTVGWISSMSGTFSPMACTLARGACGVTYTQSVVGRPTISANYVGDSNNQASSGTTDVTFTCGDYPRKLCTIVR